MCILMKNILLKATIFTTIFLSLKINSSEYDFKPYRGREPNPLDWVSISDEEHNHFSKIRFLGFNRNKLKFIKATDHRVKISTKILNYVHYSVLRIFPELKGVIPKPRVRILELDKPNGSVFPIPVCITAQLSFKGFENTQASSNIISINSEGKVFPVKSLKSCINRTSTEVNPLHIIDYFKRNNPSCEITYKNDRLVLENNCVPHKNLKSRSFTKILLPTTANVVMLTSGTFNSINPSYNTYIPILVHELSHYYKAHASMWTKNLSFFYREPEIRTKAPLTSSQFHDELGKMVLDVSNEYFQYELPNQKIPAQILPKLWKKLHEQVPKACKKDRCHRTCEDLSTYFLNSKGIYPFDTFPKNPPTNKTKTNYKTFENILFTCATRFEIGTGGLTNSALKSLFDLSISNLPESTLWDSLTKIFELERNKVSMYKDIYQNALDNRLGFYTFEQDADELAVHLMNLSKLEPRLLIDKLFFILQAYPDRIATNPFDLNYESCYSKYVRNWTDNDGQSVMIPVGNYKDMHHSSCFRIFNIDRIINAFNY